MVRQHHSGHFRLERARTTHSKSNAVLHTWISLCLRLRRLCTARAGLRSSG